MVKLEVSSRVLVTATSMRMITPKGGTGGLNVTNAYSKPSDEGKSTGEGGWLANVARVEALKGPYTGEEPASVMMLKLML